VSTVRFPCALLILMVRSASGIKIRSNSWIIHKRTWWRLYWSMNVAATRGRLACVQTTNQHNLLPGTLQWGTIVGCMNSHCRKFYLSQFRRRRYGRVALDDEFGFFYLERMESLLQALTALTLTSGLCHVSIMHNLILPS
jgi:hypothetical protein